MRIDVRETGSEPYEDVYVVIDADSGFMIAWTVACDDEEGWVIVHKCDQCGNKFRDPDTDDFLLVKLNRPIRIVRKADIPNTQRIGVVNLGMVYN